MRVLLSEFRQESNSLSPFTSGVEFWESGWLLRPPEVRSRLASEACAFRGMLDVLEESPHQPEIVIGPAYYAQSGGTSEQEVMDRYLGELLPVLEQNTPLDGVFLSCHGALQTTEFDDAEAALATKIRSLVGDDCVIAMSTDLHGYISSSSAENIDIITGYHTYPHVDFVETGRRAAELGLRAIAGEPFAMAWAPVPMMVSASAYSTLSGPFKELMDDGLELVEQGELLDFSIYQMQPWLDVPTPHSTVLTVAHDAEKAIEYANLLAAKLYRFRHDFVPALSSIEEIIDRATDPKCARPIVLVDSADSPNAGAAGDSMAVAKVLLQDERQVRAATIVRDQPAVKKAFALGVGATGEFTLGGTIDPRAPRITATGYVKSLHDGEFRNSDVGSAGTASRLGRTAVLVFGELSVVVCEIFVSPGDPQIYRAFGIDPTAQSLVVVKANTSFRSVYSRFASEIHDADTPGAAAPNVSNLPFQRLSRNIFPWTDRAFTPNAEVRR